jgi:hypothetical protein
VEILTHRVSKQELLERCTTSYPLMTKAVVDVVRGVMAVDAEWHADLEVVMLEDGSVQEDLWGINLQLGHESDEFVVYASLINIRPAQQSFSMEIADPAVVAAIRQVVDRLVDHGQDSSVREARVPYAADAPGGNVRHPAPARAYPCFKHHKQLTMEKWRSFEAYKRVMMIDNELSRAATNMPSDSDSIWHCYERALELFHITAEAARLEERPGELIHGLLRLRERVARLYAGRIRDSAESQRLRDELIALEPQAWSLLHQRPAA